MAVHKILLDDDFTEDFSLVAIHCSEEDYKVAYLLNQHLNLCLRRKQSDLDFSNNDLEVSFPIFEFEDQFQYTHYHLVGNKCKSKLASISTEGELFEEAVSERTTITHLLPEFRKADFFLKIESEFENIPLRRILAQINEIKQVISAYEIEINQIKSNNNLIFN